MNLDLARKAALILLLIATPALAGDSLEMPAGHLRGVLKELREYPLWTGAADAVTKQAAEYRDDEMVPVDSEFWIAAQKGLAAWRSRSRDQKALAIVDFRIRQAMTDFANLRDRLLGNK